MSSVDLEADMGSLPHRNDQEGASERPCDEGERVGGVRAEHGVEVRPEKGERSAEHTSSALTKYGPSPGSDKAGDDELENRLTEEDVGREEEGVGDEDGANGEGSSGQCLGLETSGDGSL